MPGIMLMFYSSSGMVSSSASTSDFIGANTPLEPELICLNITSDAPEETEGLEFVC